MAIEKTKDQEIRMALRESPYIAQLTAEDDQALLMEEFSLTSGDTRIDMAVFNGCFHGFEIKSDKDTLERLPHQAEYYAKVFEYLYLVVGVKHSERATTMLPDYWGILLAEKRDGITMLRECRPPKRNKHQDALALASMLWKAEALSLLEKHGMLKGMKSKPCRVLWKKLSVDLPFNVLEDEVRTTIKIRRNWRAALKQTRCDVTSQPSSTSSRFLAPLPF